MCSAKVLNVQARTLFKWELPISFDPIGYEIGQEDLIAQLGLLILEGRTPPENVKTNIKDCLSGDGDSFYHRKVCF